MVLMFAATVMAQDEAQDKVEVDLSRTRWRLTSRPMW